MSCHLPEGRYPCENWNCPRSVHSPSYGDARRLWTKGNSVVLEPGACYLIKGRKADSSYRLFSRLTRKTPGLVISRQFPDRVRRERGVVDSRVIWLSHTPGQDYHNPTALGSLAKLISGFIDENEGVATILLEGIEYLSVNNGFLQTLMFVEHVNEFVMQRKAIVLIPVSPDALEEKELALLERNLTDLRAPPRSKPRRGVTRQLPYVVLLIPTKPELRDECVQLRDRVPKPVRIDDSARPIGDKIRDASRGGVPFIVLVSGGEALSGIVHVIPWTGKETWMSLEALERAFKEWRLHG